MLPLLRGCLLLLSSLLVSSNAAPRSTLGNIDFPDPSLTYDPQTQSWYAFATEGNSHHVQAATAPSAMGPWSFLPDFDILPVPGKWVNQASPRVWAPDVQYIPATDTFVLYYSAASLASPNGGDYHCIGAAISLNITGPYTPLDEPMICPIEDGGAIDPAGYFDESDGSRWVLYKVDGSAASPGGPCGNGGPGPGLPTPIRLQQVDPRDGVTVIGEAMTVLDRDPEVDGPLVEAPSLVRVKGLKGDRFVLFYSSHCFNVPEYDVKYAVAKRIQGPYVRMGQLLGKEAGSFGLEATGGATAVPGGGGLLFHANCPAGRCMYETEYVVEGGVIRIP